MRKQQLFLLMFLFTLTSSNFTTTYDKWTAWGQTTPPSEVDLAREKPKYYEWDIYACFKSVLKLYTKSYCNIASTYMQINAPKDSIDTYNCCHSKYTEGEKIFCRTIRPDNVEEYYPFSFKLAKSKVIIYHFSDIQELFYREDIWFLPKIGILCNLYTRTYNVAYYIRMFEENNERKIEIKYYDPIDCNEHNETCSVSFFNIKYYFTLFELLK